MTAPTNWPQTKQSTVVQAAAPALNVETVVASVQGVSTDTPNRTIKLSAWAQMQAGTAATGLTFRIRRGSDTTGTVVATVTVPPTGGAGVSGMYDVETIDVPGEIANGGYVLTVQQTAATGNAAVTAVSLTAAVGVN